MHTIGAALFGGKDGIHFFQEIGYEHYPFTHCPLGEVWERGRCSCEQEKNFGTFRRVSLLRWRGAFDRRLLLLFLFKIMLKGGRACRSGIG